jgi:hypothetical protein
MLNAAVNTMFDEALNTKLRWFHDRVTEIPGASFLFIGKWRAQWKKDVARGIYIGGAPYSFVCDMNGESCAEVHSQLRPQGLYLGTSETLTPLEAQKALFAAGFNDNSVSQHAGVVYMIGRKVGH